MIAVDSETYLIQPGLLAPKLVCVSVAGDGTQQGTVHSASGGVDYLVDLLEEDHVVGANIAYDIAVLLAAAPDERGLVFKAYEEGRIHDVQIRQALNAIAEGHLYRHPDGGPLRDPESNKVTDRYSLSTCALLTLGSGLAKADTWRLRYAELDGIPVSDWPPEAVEYARTDAEKTLEVAKAQDRFQNLQDEAAQCRAAFALHLAACWGLRTDPVRVAEFKAKVEAEYETNRAKFKGLGIIREDGSADNKKLQGLVSDAYKGAPPLTETGRISTSRDTLKNSGDELLESYAEIGTNKTLVQTFLPTLELGTRVPINPQWKVLVETGRVACSKPNLMNLPRTGSVREAFCARPGTVFGFQDYSALELCTLAQSCIELLGQSAMAEAINSGKDLHCLLASQMAGRSYEDVLAAVSVEDAAMLAMRYASKAGNFGFGGGMGVPKFVLTQRKVGLKLCLSMGLAETCGLDKTTEWNKRFIPPTCTACLEAGQQLRDAWFAAWPEMRRYFELVAEETNRGAQIEQLVSKRLRGGCSFTNGANTRFQGLAADGAKHALWLVSRECYTRQDSPLWNSRPVIFLHDEIGVELVESRASEGFERLGEIMIEGMKKYVPDVKIKTDGGLCRNWHKGCREVRVNGKVVPVKPEKKDGKVTWVHDR